MWAVEGCEGIFSVSGVATWCGRPAGQPDVDDVCQDICPVARPPPRPKAHVYCAKGLMPEPAPSGSCGIVLLTSFFTTKMDWQRLKFVKPSFKKMQIFYSSAARRGLNVTMIYDQLPDSIVNTYESSLF